MTERWVSALGALSMLALAYAACPQPLRRRVSLRTVGGGVALLLLFAVLVLRTPVSRLFGHANVAVDRLLGFTREGSAFVFGKLVTEPQGLGFVFAFQVLPTILFFSALMSVLYHVRVMPWVIERFGRGLSRLLGTSGAESFSTVADVFVGQTEAPLVIRPYLRSLTRSELHACMVAGFATTAGGVLAAYVAMLQPFVPGIAGHLIACSVMSAPASLVISKLMWPESEAATTASPTGHAEGRSDGDRASEPRVAVPRTSENLLDAVTAGTTDGLRLAVNVGAMLIVFIALTALADAVLGWAGGLVGWQLSLQRVLGWVFTPLAWLMGVSPADVGKVGSLLGQKTVLNEFVAYTTLSTELGRDPAWISTRSQLIASYALCGFANFGSIGIQIGGYAGLAPERRGDISRLALRAMFGGLLTTCLVAAVAGILL